jgi:hypothetical protein
LILQRKPVFLSISVLKRVFFNLKGSSISGSKEEEKQFKEFEEFKVIENLEKRIEERMGK